MKIQRPAVVAATTLLFASFAFAQTNKAPAKPSTPAAAKAQTFKELDKDGNGFIDRNEAGSATGLVAMFPTLDANKDGKLSTSEYAKHEQTKHDQHK